MPSIQEAQPYIANYSESNPFQREADAAYKAYLEEIDSTEGWQCMLLLPNSSAFALSNSLKLHLTDSALPILILYC